MPPVEVKENVFWVGAIDWNIRDFHGYSTYKGSTYNSFLVMDDKITLFDTVKNYLKSDLLHNIRKIVDPAKIDYIVVNHVEMDHTGCLSDVVDLVKPEKIICPAMGKKNLLDHFHKEDWPYEVVKSGQKMSLGKKTVQFLETRMLHWPDNMFSYLQEDKLLISSDAFGQHWATSERFDDEVDFGELMQHAAKYYANILLLYSPLVQKLLKTVKDSGLEIDMVAPDHGLIWRKNIDSIIDAYDRWSRYEAKKKAIVVYDTMWHSTEMMGKAIADGLVSEAISTNIMDLKVTHRSDVVTEALDSKALIFGSSTLNNGILPKMADVLTYLKGLKPGNKIGAAFGSYGWSGEGVKIINGYLEQMKVELVDPGLRVKFIPDHDNLKKCVELGQRIGKAIKEKL